MSEQDVELPGMGAVERVELPFLHQQPKYRVHWRLIVTGYAHFTTWADPEVWIEYEAPTDEFTRVILEDPASEVEYDGNWYQVIEEQREDGTWKPLDAETWDRIEAHQGRLS